MANVARLGVVMGLDTAEFNAGLEAVSKKLDQFKDRILELGSLAAFGEMTAKALEFADSIVKTAKANDVTTASILEMSKALEENGGEADATSRVYSGFTQKLESAALGTAKAQEAFARLGVSLKDIATLTPQELFERTVTGLAKIENAAARNGLAFQVLGKSFRGIDIVGFAHDLEEAKGTMDKYAASVEEAHRLSINLGKDSREISLVFTDAIMPSLNVFYEGLHKLMDPLKSLIQLFGVLMDVVAAVFAFIEQALIQFTNILIITGSIIADVLTGNITKAKKDWHDGLDTMASDYKAFSDRLQKLANPPKKPATPDNIGGQDVIAANAKKIDAAKYLSIEYQKQALLQFNILEDSKKLLGLTKDQILVEQAVNKVKEENQRFVDNIDKQIASAGQGSAAEALKKTLREQKQIILDLKEAEMDKTKKAVLGYIEQQSTFSQGWKNAFNQYVEDATKSSKLAGDMFNSVMGSMNSAIDTFVMTGKMSFADLARSILQDLEKMILKALLWKTISSAAGMFGGGGGGMFMNEMGGMELAGSLGFASGGNPPVGVPSLVGENGPELFVPSRSGTIIPNNKLGGLGGTTNVTNNYIQAIDTKSFEDRLYGSNKAIWAANQYADKNLSTSRSRT